MNLKDRSELNQDLLAEATKIFPIVRQASSDCGDDGFDVSKWSITTTTLRRWFTDGNATIEQTLTIAAHEVSSKLQDEFQFAYLGKVEHCHAYAKEQRHVADPELEELLEHRKTIAELEGALAEKQAELDALKALVRLTDYDAAVATSVDRQHGVQNE